MKKLLALLFAVLVTGCTIALPTFPNPANSPIAPGESQCSDPRWPWHEAGHIVVAVSLSGGGKRAAAFAHGVMQGLGEISINLPDGRETNLLEQVDYITAVSGGSVAATYYALARGGTNGLQGFETFLYDNTEAAIAWRTLNPLNWFTSSAVVQADYFGDVIYNNKTFAELPRWPYLIVGATDLSRGMAFNFTRAQFACIGSDLAKYPLGHAVAASSAFPLLLGTMPVKNFSYNPERKGARGPFLNLSDGGLVDNLATRNYLLLLDRGYLVGDSKDTYRKRPRALIFIQVDGSGHLLPGFEESSASPGLFTRVSRSFEVVFERQVKDLNGQLAREISPKLDSLGVKYVLLDVALANGAVEVKQELLGVPTRWTLDREDIDLLVKAGRDIVRERKDSITDQFTK